MIGYFLREKSSKRNRTQYKYIKNEYSSEPTVTSGGRQGSVFAVFMFAIYVNDLPSLMENSTYLFDDDTKIVANLFCFGSK